MNKFLFGAGAGLALITVGTAAEAASPATQATASAKILRPLTITWVQNLDFGTIVQASGNWAGEAVVISQAGALTCGNTHLTCSGTAQPAKYKLVGTDNAIVTISSPAFNLTGPANLPFTPNAPATVNLGPNGDTAGVTFAIGGSITVASNTQDGTYTGTFNVTADYQ
jgi:Mat/Ecp fimbriae major subunit